MFYMVYSSFQMYNRENYINKGEYIIMRTEKNNNDNDSVIFEISSKGENRQNINRYTEKKEQQLSYQQKLLQEILQKNKEKG